MFEYPCDDWHARITFLVLKPKDPIAIKRGDLLVGGTGYGCVKSIDYCPVHCDDLHRGLIRGRAMKDSPAVSTVIEVNDTYMILDTDCNCVWTYPPQKGNWEKNPHFIEEPPSPAIEAGRELAKAFWEVSTQIKPEMLPAGKPEIHENIPGLPGIKLGIDKTLPGDVAYAITNTSKMMIHGPIKTRTIEDEHVGVCNDCDKIFINQSLNKLTVEDNGMKIREISLCNECFLKFRNEGHGYELPVKENRGITIL